MPAVLLRRRSPALQQHRTRTRTRTFPTAARPLRIIIWPRGSHIYSLSAVRLVKPRAPRDHAARSSSRLGLARSGSARPLARGHAAAARALTSRGRPCARAHTHVPGSSRTAPAPITWYARYNIPDAWMLLPWYFNFLTFFIRSHNKVNLKLCIGNKCEARVQNKKVKRSRTSEKQRMLK